MSRYRIDHSQVDVGIPLLPAMAKKTVITDTNTGKTAKGLGACRNRDLCSP